MIKKSIACIKEIFPYILIGMLVGYIYIDYRQESKTLSAVDMPKVEEHENDINGLKKNDPTKALKLQDLYKEF